ncbi:uncharacterized protein LOC104851785 isoform X5 [Fukomys damarensis]|uniref:uncharacterized protein LOC104851785 isoform X5 n=1 Tax=Fukomys damarensis TaxID=885580 RepID=UPI00053F9DB3|nr:uncharacterized protein LOC104851785 isoform X5 [Fukomys damarensis]
MRLHLRLLLAPTLLSSKPGVPGLSCPFLATPVSLFPPQPGFSKGLSPLLSSLTSISSSTHASRPALLRPAAAASRPFPPWLWPRLVRLKDFRQKEQEGPPGATHKTSPGISRLLPGLAKATTTRNPVEDRTVDTLPAPQCPSALNPATGSPASRPPVPSCGARAFTATGTPNARSHGTGWTQRFWTGPPLE